MNKYNYKKKGDNVYDSICSYGWMVNTKNALMPSVIFFYCVISGSNRTRILNTTVDSVERPSGMVIHLLKNKEHVQISLMKMIKSSAHSSSVLRDKS